MKKKVFAHMPSKAKGGGAKALAKISAKNVFFLDGSPYIAIVSVC